MTIDPDLFELMPVVVDCFKLTGSDGFGNNTYGPKITRRCRVEGLTKTIAVTTADGGTVLAQPGDSVSLITGLVMMVSPLTWNSMQKPA